MDSAPHRADCGTPMKAKSAKGHTLKHARAKKTKHHATSKHHPVHHAKAATAHAHHVTAKAKHPHHAKARGLALTPGDVACCAAEALAASLRLAGRAVSDEDVMALYWHTADDPDAGATVEATLEAAWRFGLGGVRPARFAEEVLDYPPLPLGQRLRDRLEVELGEHDHLVGFRPLHPASLILGLELPGPHTVLATPDGWWSWGQLWCPCEWPDAVIEEAWAVSWS
jgi:hypothetical protein